MSDQINILDALGGDHEPTLERVRINESDTALILFTPKGEETAIHYCDEPEISNSVICLESDCLLCRIGRKPDERCLIPIYLPASHCMAVLFAFWRSNVRRKHWPAATWRE